MKQRFFELLRQRFNSGVRYKDRALKWDTVIEQKTVELSRYLAGRTGGLDFSDPSPILPRADDNEVRRRILTFTVSEARKLGIGKSTLHNLHKNAKSARSFRIYQRVRDKLESRTKSGAALVQCLQRKIEN